MIKKMCTYCASWYDVEEMTPLFEEGKENLICWYCKKCLPVVKSNISQLPWSHLYHFGEKGKL